MPRVAAEPYEVTFQPSTAVSVIIDVPRDFMELGGFGEALGNDMGLLRSAVGPTERALWAVRVNATVAAPAPASPNSRRPGS
jgi:hypothetical protein